MLYIILSLVILASPSGDKDKKIRQRMNKDAPTGTVWVKDNLYIDKYEISNLDYREYLAWISLKDGEDIQEYKNAHPDTLVWRSPNAYNEPFVSLYFRHPAYSNYPVVGLSYEQALGYCHWRTKRVNEAIYKNINKINILEKVDSSIIPEYVKYRLPSKEEWEYAARGGLKESDFPWGGYFITNNKGEAMANFHFIGDEWISYNDSLKRYEIVPADCEPMTLMNLYTITAPVDAFSANGYGIFNICGNVAEMVKEKGIAKGGSWNLPGYQLRISQDWKYKKPTDDIGFRCVCEKLIKY